MNYRVKKMIMDGGERICLVIDKESELPVYYQNLFLTTMIRNRSATISTMEIVATKLIIFSEFCKRNKISLKERIINKSFLTLSEIESLMRFLRQRFDHQSDNVRKISNTFISKRTYHYRITIVAHYLEWLCGVLHSHSGIHARNEVNRFIKSIMAYQSRSRSLKLTDIPDRSLDNKQIIELFRLLEIGSEQNPFTKDVQKRNRLIFSLLLQLGLRAGELLNLNLSDFDFRENTVFIRRRHDDRKDCRVNQPLVKTRERLIPLSDKLASEIHDYICNERELVSGKKKHGYLLVTHGSGNTAGDALSVSAYEKIISTLKKESSILSGLSGHRLRHSWNYLYSKEIKNSSLSSHQNDQLRKYFMGWSETSGMPEVYNRRIMNETEKETILKMQDKITNLLKGGTM